MPTVVQDLLRSFCAMIDKVVYWGIDLLSNLFDSLAGIRIFSSDQVDDFARRIYLFLAIIMIFKVSFSIIQYIINPDMFSDKERGVGKLVQNFLLTLVAIVIVPWGFKILYDVEKDIVDSGIIESLILGVPSNENENGISENNQKEIKQRIPFLLLRSFVVPNANLKEINYSSKNGYCWKAGNSICLYNIKDGSYNEEFVKNLGNLSSDVFSYAIDVDSTSIVSGSFGDAFPEAYKRYNYTMLLDIINAKYINDDDVYVLEYKLLLSTVAGIFVIILYLNFCIDLAIRTAKISFLQLIAPIPIVSMIDPKSSKSGMMSKWIKNCLSTYAGLFIRIAAVNFVVYLTYIVMNGSIFSNVGVGDAGLFVRVVVLFGALMFAKELPKLIADLTGIDMKGNFKINPFKRVEDDMILGKNLTGMAAGLASRGIPGLVGGFFGGQGLTKTWQAQNQRKATNQAHRRALQVARQNGSTWGGRMGERFHNYTGIGRNATQRIEDDEYKLSLQESALAESEAKIAESEAKMAEKEAIARAEIESRNKVSDVVSKMEDRAKDRIINGQAGDFSAEYLARQNKADQLKTQSDMYVQQAMEARKNIAALQQARANTKVQSEIAAYDKALESENSALTRAENMSERISNEYANQVMSNSAFLENAMYSYIDKGDDKVISNLKSDYNSLTDTYGFDKKTSASDRHGQSGEFKGLNSEATRNFNEHDKIRAQNAEEKRKIAEQKRQLSEQKRQLSERKKASQANTNAVNRSNGR